MTREQIEKAAIKFAKSYYLEKYGNMNAEITEDEFDALVCSIAYMFMHGAQWRINSVWHDANEKPDKNQFVLFECRKTYGRGYSVNFGENYDLMKNVVLKWAYVIDLLPESKGGLNNDRTRID